MIERFRSPAFARVIVWGSGLVLIAGVVAFVTVRLGSEDSPPVADRGTVPAGYAAEDLPGADTQTTPKESDVPNAARDVAGEFVLAAVGRENLPKAWKLADRDLKQACACTYEEWLTGNIPVQYFPTKGLEGASFAVNEVSPGRVVLQVLLTPGKNEDGLGPTEFYIGLRQRGGKGAPWLVDYWAPVNVVAVPAAPGGGAGS
ncbi:MAG: hypothetical protein M5U27_03990 [Gaiella sp.]|nr:hypothetical protein [Gaiella sp.]